MLVIERCRPLEDRISTNEQLEVVEVAGIPGFCPFQLCPVRTDMRYLSHCPPRTLGRDSSACDPISEAPERRVARLPVAGSRRPLTVHINTGDLTPHPGARLACDCSVRTWDPDAQHLTEGLFLFPLSITLPGYNCSRR